MTTKTKAKPKGRAKNEPPPRPSGSLTGPSLAVPRLRDDLTATGASSRRVADLFDAAGFDVLTVLAGSSECVVTFDSVHGLERRLREIGGQR